jgi:hypothetical protein
MRAASRLAKLAVMSPAELRGRVGDRLYAVWERRAIRRRAPAEVRLQRALRRGLSRRSDWRSALLSARRSSAGRFFAWVDEPEGLRRLLASRYSAGAARSIARADRALAGRIELFGRPVALGDPIAWHTDPFSGVEWPLVYHADVPLEVESPGQPDVKHVWELNRQQVLLDLGKAWLLTRNRAYAAQALSWVADWIHRNPYGVGVNWAGPLEAAYRALSWMWVYAQTADDLAPDDDRRLLWLAGFLDHGRFLHRHLERFSSPYNHLIGEASALYALGTLFPEFREAGAWRRLGRATLESRLAAQFYPDGGSVEQAAVYHHATLGFYLIAAIIGRRNGEEFSDNVWGAIERAIEFSAWLAQPDGRQPALGDNDDARPIVFDLEDVWDFRAFQSIGAVLFGRRDFKSAAGRFHEEGVWLLGPEAASQFDALDAARPDAASRAFTGAGYVVLRSSWDAAADYVCFDCGEQAGGLRTDGVPSAAHGHADCLSVVASIGGRPVLVDSGFYTYNGDERWERFFRETAAHNTARIDQRDQARRLGRMAWAEAPRVVLDAWETDGQGWASAAHDGYARGSNGVTHRRMVWLRPPGLVIIYDVFVGAGDHEVEAAFHLAPDLPASIEGRAVVAGGKVFLAWTAAPSLEPTIVRGGDGPESGWLAPRLGAREPASRLVLRGRFAGGRAELLTVVGDRALWSEGVSELAPPDGGLALEIRARDRAELIACATWADAAAMGGAGASVVVQRTSAACGIEIRRAGGRREAIETSRFESSPRTTLLPAVQR